jgi:hypothetical protein
VIDSENAHFEYQGDLWWTKWHMDKFLSEFFAFLLSISFRYGSIIIIQLQYTSHGGAG